MSKKDIHKLYFIKEKIEDIESYKDQFPSIVHALANKMSFDAILMCLLQIGETINKLESGYEILNDEDIKGAYKVRNFIAHDYEGVNKATIENIIRCYLPILKSNIEELIEQGKN